MDALFQELLRTLGEAREALDAEFEQHARAYSLDAANLERLQRSAGEFGDQADALVTMMDNRGADEAWIRQAEELAGVFRDIQYQVFILLKQGQG